MGTRQQAVMVAMGVAENDGQQIRIATVRQTGNRGEQVPMCLGSIQRQAKIEEQRLAISLHLYAVAANLGSPTMNPKAHGNLPSGCHGPFAGLKRLIGDQGSPYVSQQEGVLHRATVLKPEFNPVVLLQCIKAHLVFRHPACRD